MIYSHRNDMTGFLTGLTKQERLAFLVAYLKAYVAAVRSGKEKIPSGKTRRGVLCIPPDRHSQARSPLSTETCAGAEYDREQVEFMMAMQREQENLGRKLRDYEILGAAKGMGYKLEGKP